MLPHRHLCCLALLLALVGVPSSHAAEEKPRLAVLVVFDQLRGDYLRRWDKLFGEGGFHRLEKEGAWFQNCHYPYSDTITAAGHASLATGAMPRTHGIIANDWYERTSAASVNCVSSERYERVPPRFGGDSAEAETKKPKGVSPERLQTPTLADAFKEATAAKGASWPCLSRIAPPCCRVDAGPMPVTGWTPSTASLSLQATIETAYIRG